MSTKHKLKRDVEQTDLENAATAKKIKSNDDVQNNNNDGTEHKPVNEHKPATVKTSKANKLPEEVLKRYDSEPGKLLIAGNVDWDFTGKKGKREELLVFNRFTDEKYRAIFSGSTSAHSLVIDMNYKVHSFGRNSHGQCGHKQLISYKKPMLIDGLKDVNVIQAACGQNHSLFLTDTGVVYACGDNTNGQVGIPKKGKQTIVAKPTRINYRGPPIVKVGCGAEFSAVLDIDGSLYTFGLPEFGQLGHNTDGKYFITCNKLAFDIQYSPKCVTSYVDKTKEGHTTPVSNVKIVDFACGKNHTIAIDSEKRAYSFGFGGYGRLGHNEQKDEWIPRLIKYINARTSGGAVRAFCGSTFSLVIGDHKNPLLFGKNKNSANGQLYPKIVDDLCGFNIKSIGCSFTSIVLACDNGKLVAWGASPTHGELGIGESPKSSSTPIFVESMNDVNVSQVAMGQEHTLLIVNTDDNTSNEKYLSQPEYAPDVKASA